jgi:hypothetical protein
MATPSRRNGSWAAYLTSFSLERGAGQTVSTSECVRRLGAASRIIRR